MCWKHRSLAPSLCPTDVSNYERFRRPACDDDLNLLTKADGLRASSGWYAFEAWIVSHLSGIWGYILAMWFALLWSAALAASRGCINYERFRRSACDDDLHLLTKNLMDGQCIEMVCS